MAQSNYNMALSQNSKALLVFVVAALVSACAALQPPETGGPGPSGPTYPVVFTADSQRKEGSVLALNRITHGNSPADQVEVYLQPVTATMKSLPTNLTTPLYLPKVGTKPEMTEEETREALRRFVNDWRGLIGSDPLQLSLVERTDQSDRTKIARYEQRPFRYALRGDYGKLEIHFTADRRLLNLSSTCIPDVERLQAALANVTPRVKLEDAIKRVRENAVTYTDSAGSPQTYQLSTGNEISGGELVTYVLLSRSRPDSLEFHLAWEIGISNAPFKAIYLDALDNEIIAAR